MTPFRSVRHVRLALTPLAVLLAFGCSDVGGPIQPGGSAPLANLQPGSPPSYQTGQCGAPSRLQMEDFGLKGILRSGDPGDFLLRVYDAQNCRIYPSGGVSWSVTNSAVASIEYPNTTGPGQTLRGKLAGYTVLKVSYGGLSGEYTLQVVPGNPTRVAITPADLNVTIGGTASLSGAVFDQAGNRITDRTLTWSSNKPSTASVFLPVAYNTADARVQATSSVSSAGEATITATLSGSSLSGSARVRVTVPECYCPPGVTCTCEVYPPLGPL